MVNLAELLDDAQTTQDVCVRLLGFVNRARTLSNDELPLEVPLVFFSGRAHQHPHGMVGSFEYLREVASDGTNRVRIPCGQESNGAQIVEPALTPAPAFPPLVPPAQPGPPNPPAAGNTANAAPQQDPAALINDAMAAMQAMTHAMCK